MAPREHEYDDSLVDDILKAEHAKRQLELFEASRLNLSSQEVDEYLAIVLDGKAFHAPLQTPNATWQDQVRAQRNGWFNERLRRVEAEDFQPVQIVAPLEEQPVEPDAAIAAERVPSPVRRLAAWAGRRLVAFGEAS